MRDHQKKLIIYVIILAVATVMWPRLSVFADEDLHQIITRGHSPIPMGLTVERQIVCASL